MNFEICYHYNYKTWHRKQLSDFIYHNWLLLPSCFKFYNYYTWRKPVYLHVKLGYFLSIFLFHIFQHNIVFDLHATSKYLFSSSNYLGSYLKSTNLSVIYKIFKQHCFIYPLSSDIGKMQVNCYVWILGLYSLKSRSLFCI